MRSLFFNVTFFLAITFSSMSWSIDSDNGKQCVGEGYREIAQVSITENEANPNFGIAQGSSFLEKPTSLDYTCSDGYKCRVTNPAEAIEYEVASTYGQDEDALDILGFKILESFESVTEADEEDHYGRYPEPRSFWDSNRPVIYYLKVNDTLGVGCTNYDIINSSVGSGSSSSTCAQYFEDSVFDVLDHIGSWFVDQSSKNENNENMNENNQLNSSYSNQEKACRLAKKEELVEDKNELTWVNVQDSGYGHGGSDKNEYLNWVTSDWSDFSFTPSEDFRVCTKTCESDNECHSGVCTANKYIQSKNMSAGAQEMCLKGPKARPMGVCRSHLECASLYCQKSNGTGVGAGGYGFCRGDFPKTCSCVANAVMKTGDVCCPGFSEIAFGGESMCVAANLADPKPYTAYKFVVSSVAEEGSTIPSCSINFARQSSIDAGETTGNVASISSDIKVEENQNADMADQMFSSGEVGETGEDDDPLTGMGYEDIHAYIQNNLVALLALEYLFSGNTDSREDCLEFPIEYGNSSKEMPLSKIMRTRFSQVIKNARVQADEKYLEIFAAMEEKVQKLKAQASNTNDLAGILESGILGDSGLDSLTAEGIDQIIELEDSLIAFQDSLLFGPSLEDDSVTKASDKGLAYLSWNNPGQLGVYDGLDEKFGWLEANNDESTRQIAASGSGDSYEQVFNIVGNKYFNMQYRDSWKKDYLDGTGGKNWKTKEKCGDFKRFGKNAFRTVVKVKMGGVHNLDQEDKNASIYSIADGNTVQRDEQGVGSIFSMKNRLLDLPQPNTGLMTGGNSNKRKHSLHINDIYEYYKDNVGKYYFFSFQDTAGFTSSINEGAEGSEDIPRIPSFLNVNSASTLRESLIDYSYFFALLYSYNDRKNHKQDHPVMSRILYFYPMVQSIIDETVYYLDALSEARLAKVDCLCDNWHKNSATNNLNIRACVNRGSGGGGGGGGPGGGGNSLFETSYMDQPGLEATESTGEGEDVAIEEQNISEITLGTAGTGVATSIGGQVDGKSRRNLSRGSVAAASGDKNAVSDRKNSAKSSRKSIDDALKNSSLSGGATPEGFAKIMAAKLKSGLKGSGKSGRSNLDFNGSSGLQAGESGGEAEETSKEEYVDENLDYSGGDIVGGKGSLFGKSRNKGRNGNRRGKASRKVASKDNSKMLNALNKNKGKYKRNKNDTLFEAVTKTYMRAALPVFFED